MAFPESNRVPRKRHVRLPKVAFRAYESDMGKQIFHRNAQMHPWMKLAMCVVAVGAWGGGLMARG
jgi:hypothetical protein